MAQAIKKLLLAIMIHCAMEERARKMTIPANGLPLVQKIREDPKPLYYTNSEDIKKEHFNIRLTMTTVGSISAWITS